ncbi:DUF1853 family protein [Advenella mimigardefordensis]|nr:DUF1853 family protein [Advenella mimigardefordensis]
MSTSASTQTIVPDTTPGPGQSSQAWHDLHWLIDSPDLLAPATDLPLARWPALAQQEIHQWLAQEGHTPQTLTHDFHTRFRRLGLYAEALLHAALQHADSIELLAHHSPIHINTNRARSATRQTIGELDYIWRDRSNQQVWHWELAVKFYLYVPQAHGLLDADRFVGLQQRDTLARKTAKMRDQQLPLSAMPEVTQQLGLHVNHVAAYVKGWLFYPIQSGRCDDYVLAAAPAQAMLNPRHLRGWWLRYADFVTHLEQDTAPGKLRWRVLSRMQWLSPQQADVAQTLDATALLAYLQSWFCPKTTAHGPGPGLLVVALAPVDSTVPAISPDASATDVAERASAAAASETRQAPPAPSGQTYAEVHRGFVVPNAWVGTLL